MSLSPKLNHELRILVKRIAEEVEGQFSGQ